MIFYFTGTGNSRYIAETIAGLTGDEIADINARIKGQNTETICVQDRLVFVLPTYGWRIPRIVETWIRKTEWTGVCKAWFILNCGSGMGNAAGYIQKLCEEKKFQYMGTAEIVMPENYIAMFQTPDFEEAETIIKRADPEIKKAGNRIREDREFPKPSIHLADRFLSAAINPVFYRLFVKADPFYVKETCISCGKCEAVCPLNNIQMQGGKPVWGKDCTHCMACISRCPAEAIEYGKKSKGKPRYYCGRDKKEG